IQFPICSHPTRFIRPCSSLMTASCIISPSSVGGSDAHTRASDAMRLPLVQGRPLGLVQAFFLAPGSNLDPKLCERPLTFDKFSFRIVGKESNAHKIYKEQVILEFGQNLQDGRFFPENGSAVPLTLALENVDPPNAAGVDISSSLTEDARLGIEGGAHKFASRKRDYPGDIIHHTVFMEDDFRGIADRLPELKSTCISGIQ
ncbi:hypothetical protein MJG53_006806, partial [Ovis ammon polii x Ovis aries]